jgi:hypothetical protein
MSFTENVKNSLSWGTLKCHICNGVFVTFDGMETIQNKRIVFP